MMKISDGLKRNMESHKEVKIMCVIKQPIKKTYYEFNPEGIVYYPYSGSYDEQQKYILLNGV